MGTTRRKAGLLGPHVEGYRGWLAGRGYTASTIRNMLKDLGLVGISVSRVRLSGRTVMSVLKESLDHGKTPIDFC